MVKSTYNKTHDTAIITNKKHASELTTFGPANMNTIEFIQWKYTNSGYEKYRVVTIGYGNSRALTIGAGEADVTYGGPGTVAGVGGESRDMAM